MTVSAPEQASELLAQAINEAELDAALALFEADGTVVATAVGDH
jgi:hypothetical protein